MKKFLLSIAVFASAIVGFSQAPCSDLFFSEYIEGTSNNKALEVYNPTTDTIDLSVYHIYRYTNGGAVQSDTLYMTGMLFPGQTYNIVNPSADSMNLEIYADTTHTITFYNGDDPLYLFNGITLIDVIGEATGTDPGVNWPVDTGATSEFTLVRKPTVFSGTTSWTAGATQWDVYAQNDFTHFNSHTINTCPVGFGIEDQSGWDVSIYPNPTSGHLNINSEMDNYNLQLFDLTGKVMINKTHLSKNTQIDLSDLTNGIYMVKLNNGANQLTKKIVVKK